MQTTQHLLQNLRKNLSCCLLTAAERYHSKRMLLPALFIGALSGNTHATTIIKVGSAQDSTDGTYPFKTIKFAYASIATPVSDAYVIELQAGYDPTIETYPITFTAKTGASAINNITIKPAIGVKKTLANPLATNVLTANSTQISKFTVASTVGMAINHKLAGTGITAGTTITDITGNVITLSAPASTVASNIVVAGATPLSTTKADIKTSGTTASGSTNITLTTVQGITLGDAITGVTGITNGTTVTVINATTKVITISAATTASISTGASLKFTSAKLLATSVTGVNVGDYIYGTGINNGTKITAIDATNKILTLSENATVSNAAALTIGTCSAIPTAVTNTIDATLVSGPGLAVGQKIYGIGAYVGGPFTTISSIEGSTIAFPTPGPGIASGATIYAGIQGTQTILFNGASYVTIDGISRTDATTGLTIQNPNSINCQTIMFTGASYNTIQNCFIKGSNITGQDNNGTSGQIYFNTGTNSYNSINHNDICDIDNYPMPINMIGMQPNGGATNHHNTIEYNNMYNIGNGTSPANGNVGFIQFPSANSNTTTNNNYILNNKMYWTKPAIFNTGFVAIGFGGNANGLGNRVEGNVIGYGAPDGTGTATLTSLTGNTAVSFSAIANAKNSTVKNNIVGGINLTAKSFIGISTQTYTETSMATDDYFNNNQVKDIAITTTATGATAQGMIIGIQSPFAITVKNNRVSNLSLLPTDAANTCSVTGIDYAGTASTSSCNYSSNQVYNLAAGTGTSATNAMIGLKAGANAVNIEKNLIHSLNLYGNTGSYIRGLQLTDGNTTGTFVKNNIIRLGNDVTSNLIISGLYQNGVTTTGCQRYFYHNTVYLGGTSGSISTYIFGGNSTKPSFTFKNNLFINKRSGGSGYNRIYFQSTQGDIIASDYNIYDYNGKFYMLGSTEKTYAEWKTANSTFEAHTASSIDPLFAAATASTPNMVITNGADGITVNPADDAGDDLSATVTDDYFGNARTGNIKKDIGAIGLDADNFSTFIGTDNVWNNAGNWTKGIPTASSTAYIPTGKSVTPGINNAAAKNLVNTGTLTIGANDALTISENLIHSADSTGFIIQSDAAGTGQLKVNGQASGTISFERYMGGKQFHLFASPLVGQSITRFLTNSVNANISTKKDSEGNLTQVRAFTDYNSTNNTWNAYFTNATSGNLESGKGYLIRTKDAIGGNIKTTGALTTSNIQVPVTTNWNCIGNPYTTALSASAIKTDNDAYFNSSNDGLFKAIYVWDNSGSGQYVTDATTIQAGQAFLVRIAEGKTTFPLTTSMQTVNNTVPFRSAAWTEVKLFATDGTDKYFTQVKFNDEMSNGVDASYDAALLRSNNSFSLYTRLLNDNPTDICLQALPTTTDAIPVGLDYTAGGKITFTASSFPEGFNVILEDRQTKVFTDLSLSNASYTAEVAENTQGTGRFYLYANPNKITTGATSTEKASTIAAYFSADMLTIKGDVKSNGIATVYDIMGKTVASYKLNAGNLQSFPVSLNSGTYVVKVTDGDKSVQLKLNK